MEDIQLIDAFVNSTSQGGFAETVHVEGDVLILDGYWHFCMRVGRDTFIVRNEEPPIGTKVLEQTARVLHDRGLQHVASDLPGLTVLTMNKASLGYVDWHVWSSDLPTGEADVARAVTDDTVFTQSEWAETDYTAELHGARRLAHLPTSVILSVGVGTEPLDALGAVLGDCVFVQKKFGEIDADQCGSLVPTLILVEASEQVGREFVMQLRAASCSRVLPLVAVTPGAETPLGADAAVDAGEDPKSWALPIRSLLP
ncbi:MAG: hypothetical protein ACRD2W_10500 [Acidimicrobiales bacterium]